VFTDLGSLIADSISVRDRRRLGDSDRFQELEFALTDNRYLLHTLAERTGATLHLDTITELSDELGIAKSTIHRHLKTLQSDGYVVKEGDTYRIGMQFLDLGTYARDQVNAFHMAKPKVDELADEIEAALDVEVEA
jgi:DNA-binding IclR family transcriptional regulator